MKVYILDSGGSGLDKIVTWLSEDIDIKEISVINRADEFLKKVKNEHPELVFIRLGNDDIPGLKTGRMVKDVKSGIRIVFVSEENDHALDAYEVGANGYLLCPIEKKKFDSILSKAKQETYCNNGSMKGDAKW